jgi:two-component system response regulator AtoC
MHHPSTNSPSHLSFGKLYEVEVLTPFGDTESCAPTILVIYQDHAVLQPIVSALKHRFKLRLISVPDRIDEELNSETPPDLILLDSSFNRTAGGRSALELIKFICTTKPLIPLVLMYSADDLHDLVNASQIGVRSFIFKPLRSEDLELAVRKLSGDNPSDSTLVKEIPLDEKTSFVRASGQMCRLESQCRLVSTTDIPVLILGESGTGKEIAAMLIHQLSPRSQRSFLKVNCAAMPADLLESELFGYEQGAFTGAVKSKPGKFELCDHGTIFLDEIGEMPPQMQAKLLHVLQDGTFSRLGSRTTQKVNIRVIAATNVNIREAIKLKTFREDLYYRLNGFTIAVPALRERPEEIPHLARYFLGRNAVRFNCSPLAISPKLLQALQGHSWPGNLRELDNVMKRYLVLGDEWPIIDELRLERDAVLASSTCRDMQPKEQMKLVLRQHKKDAEAELISRILEANDGSRKATAVSLCISYRSLLSKIKEYKLAG